MFEVLEFDRGAWSKSNNLDGDVEEITIINSRGMFSGNTVILFLFSAK